MSTTRPSTGPELQESHWHIRQPDHQEEKAGLTLQIWGNEGYWHIIDHETRDLLQKVSQPTCWKDILAARPEWGGQADLILQTLQSVKCGLTHNATPMASRIENVSLNLTTGCNLHCATCYVFAQDRNPQRLNSNAAIALLERLKPHLSPTATLSLLGGEPFMHPEGVLAIAGWARKNGYVCNVSTNGTVPLKALASQIRRLDLRVQVSVDGANAQTNDAIRGKGTFTKALETARDLIAARVHTTLCMVACWENRNDIGDYLRLAQALGASEARIIPLKRLGNAMSGEPKQLSQLLIVQTVAGELQRNPSLEPLCQSDLYAILQSLVREQSLRQSCGSGTQTLLLQADGTIYPCTNSTLPQARLGTFTDDLPTLLQKGRQWERGLSVDNPEHPCHPCAMKRWCLAGCPGETIQREGELRRPHGNCADLKGAITFMMWQNAGKAASHRAERTRI